MLWLPTSGGGWALQPTDPVHQGCVITAGTHHAFGFKQAVRTFVAVLAFLAMVWLCAYGHTIEVIGAVFAAVLIETTTGTAKHIAQSLGKQLGQNPSGTVS